MGNYLGIDVPAETREASSRHADRKRQAHVRLCRTAHAAGRFPAPRAQAVRDTRRCEHGVCGACTVAIDGRAVRSCLRYAVQADGADIRTVEGLADGDKLNPLQ